MEEDAWTYGKLLIEMLLEELMDVICEAEESVISMNFWILSNLKP